MFVQIHILQSLPPGNLNRDENGQPKSCLFGGVTRGRISSQCLKRNIRKSTQFKEAFGEELANRTQLFPELIGRVLSDHADFPKEDIAGVMAGITGRFKKEKSRRGGEEEAETEEATSSSEEGAPSPDTGGKTPQLVFFPMPFATAAAEEIVKFRSEHPAAYRVLVNPKAPKAKKDEFKGDIEGLVERIAQASKRLTVDIALFGRMTTSDLVVNVEASCQVAHAISTHEVLIESDYFTAMDDLKKEVGAGFIGSGETETFFNSAVYYKYLNLDLDNLRKNLLSFTEKDAARVAGVLVNAAAFAPPTGKQNAFASYGPPSLILIEVSRTKRPITYANAFLQPVEGGVGRNLLTNSANALQHYFESTAKAFTPKDMRRVLLAVDPAKVALKGCEEVESAEELFGRVETLISEVQRAGTVS